MLKGNKGEWSEVYALFKILGERNLYSGGGELEIVESLIYPVVAILRQQSNGTTTFTYSENLVLVTANGEVIAKVPTANFLEFSKLLLKEIKSASNSSFQIKGIESTLNLLNIQSLKASSSTKSDIRIVVHDEITQSEPTLGFSIKSQLGNPSTLLNAGRTTNFIFKLSGNITDKELDFINQIESKSKIQDRLKNLENLGVQISFSHMENSVFHNNLVLIDTALPAILAKLLYLFFTTKESTINKLVSSITRENPLGFDLSHNHPFYEYKIKRFLSDIALGMMPSKIWTGKLDSTGGYLVIKENGEVLCYHIYNRNQFEDYLFRNVKFDTASSNRHEFGKIYKIRNEHFFNLNLQIRFIK